MSLGPWTPSLRLLCEQEVNAHGSRAVTRARGYLLPSPTSYCRGRKSLVVCSCISTSPRLCPPASAMQTRSHRPLQEALPACSRPQSPTEPGRPSHWKSPCQMWSCPCLLWTPCVPPCVLVRTPECIGVHTDRSWPQCRQSPGEASRAGDQSRSPAQAVSGGLRGCGGQ